MREQKFRLWHDGLMYAVFELRFDVSGVSEVHAQHDAQHARYHAGRLSDAYVLMQFTGLLDKNDKEICEGDIVRNDTIEGAPVGSVTWLEDAAAFVICLPDKTSVFLLYEEWEVIGNIYEHPQLLNNGNCSECGCSLQRADHDIIHDAWLVTQANIAEGERQRKAAWFSSLYAPNMGDKPIDYPLEYHEYQYRDRGTPL